MLRRRLSLQLALAMLLVALVPLVGAGALVLSLLEASLTAQIRSSQAELGAAAAALVRDHLNIATTKLKSIAAMIRKDEDPQLQTRRLNTLLDPPDLFLEIGYWTVSPKEAEVQAQAQQSAFNQALGNATLSNRQYNPRVRQQVPAWTNRSPILFGNGQAAFFIAGEVDNVGPFIGLPMSVPAPGGAAVTATLDLSPVSQMLRSIGGSTDRIVVLRNASGTVLAADAPPPLGPAISSRVPAGHAGWMVEVAEPRDRALAPLLQARDRALAVFGAAVAMAIGLAFLFAGRVVRPVRALARTADRVGRGDFAARTGIVREDEIGQLAQAFDRMAAAVEQLDRLKDDFVSQVSHELRTPLTSAKATVANVQEGISGPSALGRVQEDLNRLIRMVNELLDVARIDAGIELARQPTDLAALVRTAADTIRPLARIPLAVSGTGETLDLDPARVHQIVLNLVDNALKHARSRVDVEVRGREVRVTDDGPGVPPEDRERIFEKFSRAGSGPQAPGVGLGLSIARKLAQLHGGSLVCEGSSFVLRF